MEDSSAAFPVAEIQRFCMHDGPGVRTVVFFKGCPLRCAWCHNPEMGREGQDMLFYPGRCISCGACVSACPAGAQSVYPQRRFERDLCKACGLCAQVCCTDALVPVARVMTAGEILSAAMKDKAFYGEAGGITLSGGEALLQGERLLPLLSSCKEAGLNTVVETCGYFDGELIPALIPLVDLFLFDVKDTDRERHKAYTGVSNEGILDNLRRLDALGGKTRLRCILVAGVNTEEAHYAALAELCAGLSHCQGVEFIPYHAYGGSKMVLLGYPDNGRVEWIPTADAVREAVTYLRERGVKAWVNGE